MARLGLIVGVAEIIVAHAVAADAQATFVKAGEARVFATPPEGAAPIAVGGPDYSRSKLNALEPWFVNGTCGGGPGVTFPPPDPAQARAALAMFQRVVADYPTSESAPMSSYFVAVIYDYCLKDPARDITSYEAFVAAHDTLEPYTTTAMRRLGALKK